MWGVTRIIYSRHGIEEYPDFVPDGETERRRRKGMKDKTASGRGSEQVRGGGGERATARMRGIISRDNELFDSLPRSKRKIN